MPLASDDDDVDDDDDDHDGDATAADGDTYFPMAMTTTMMRMVMVMMATNSTPILPCKSFSAEATQRISPPHQIQQQAMDRGQQVHPRWAQP